MNYMDTAAKSVRNPPSRAGRNGTAEPVSRDQILRRKPDREVFIFPVQLATSRIGNLTRLVHTIRML